MTLEVRTNSSRHSYYPHTAAVDPQMFPKIELYISGDNHFSIVCSEGDDYEDDSATIASGNTRDECVTAMEEYIKSCVNALGAMKELKHTIPTNYALPRVGVPPDTTAERFADYVYAFGLSGPVAYAIMNGEIMYKHQVKWKEVLGL